MIVLNVTMEIKENLEKAIHNYQQTMEYCQAGIQAEKERLLPADFTGLVADQLEKFYRDYVIPHFCKFIPDVLEEIRARYLYYEHLCSGRFMVGEEMSKQLRKMANNKNINICRYRQSYYSECADLCHEAGIQFVDELNGAIANADVRFRCIFDDFIYNILANYVICDLPEMIKGYFLLLRENLPAVPEEDANLPNHI